MIAELAFERVTGARARRTIAFLHGILGSGRNLRAVARRFVEARPEWTAWLVDLRGHGASPKRSAHPSLAAAARDVIALASSAPMPLAALAGHSFGGKVALEVARTTFADARPLPLEHVVVIDSLPGARQPPRGDDSALAVLDAIDAQPRVFASKRAFVAALQTAGTSRAVAEWLALSLEPEDDAVRFALDTAEMRALVLDHFAADLWPVVEHPPDDLRVHLVIGDRSGAFSFADRARAARIGDRTTVDVLPTDHWVHAEDPEGLVRVLLARIPPG